MDFTSRNGQQQSGRVAPSGPLPQSVTPPHNPTYKDDGSQKKRMSPVPGWIRVAKVVLLFSVTILALAVSTFLYSFNPNESKYVDSSKYQFVTLSNGQYYFGKLRVVTAKYYELENIFYLNPQTDQTKTTTDANKKFTLIKLGCELYAPTDQMIINRDQVSYWENIKNDGQVSKTIAEWYNQHPNGEKCSTVSTDTTQSSASTSSTDSTAATGTATTSTTTDTTKK